jgi:hypothetical protein
MTTSVGLVRATDPPTLAVEVGVEVVVIAPPPEDTIEICAWNHPGPIRMVEQQVDPRVDLVCMTVEFGSVLGRSVAGKPAPAPEPPPCPKGWLPVALVMVRPSVREIHQEDITEVWP